MSNKFLTKPSNAAAPQRTARFERFNLAENPFPSEPAVNPLSSDPRTNGTIYEASIRSKEYESIVANFISQPQSDTQHLRLGFIADRSYVGRGNGKTAFLIQLKEAINREYAYDLSDGNNRCFCVIANPESGGRTKTFVHFTDCVFSALVETILQEALAGIMIRSIAVLNSSILEMSGSESQLMDDALAPKSHIYKTIKLEDVIAEIEKDANIRNLPKDFQLALFGAYGLQRRLPAVSAIINYYNNITQPNQKLEFVYSHLVNLFLAAGFNGAFILVDNFELMPDFQTGRQKKDFALELRSCLFDGTYINARIGFFNFLIVLHAGVEGLLGEAWSAAGMQQRAPLSSGESNHIVRFEKLTQKHVEDLIKKYLQAYRIEKTGTPSLSPFELAAIHAIAEKCEFNAAEILRIAYQALDRAANDESINVIDSDFVDDFLSKEDKNKKGMQDLTVIPAIDLREKIQERANDSADKDSV